MNRLGRLALIVVVLVAFVAGARLAYPAWAADLGIDFWNLPELEDELAADIRLGEQIKYECEIKCRTVALRLALCDDLIANRASLADVLSQFLALNRAEPGRMETIAWCFPAASEEESTFLQVCSFIRTALAREPTRCQQVLARVQLSTLERPSPLRGGVGGGVAVLGPPTRFQ